MTAAREPAPLRIARATRRLVAMTRFYREALGFAVVDQFTGHAGYTGVIFALPGGIELEITQHERGRSAAPPDPDDLLVIYLPSSSRVALARARLEVLGHASVEPVNPWWRSRSVTFADPDGWRIVLCDGADR